MDIINLIKIWLSNNNFNYKYHCDYVDTITISNGVRIRNNIRFDLNDFDSVVVSNWFWSAKHKNCGDAVHQNEYYINKKQSAMIVEYHDPKFFDKLLYYISVHKCDKCDG